MPAFPDLIVADRRGDESYSEVLTRWDVERSTVLARLAAVTKERDARDLEIVMLRSSLDSAARRFRTSEDQLRRMVAIVSALETEIAGLRSALAPIPWWSRVRAWLA